MLLGQGDDAAVIVAYTESDAGGEAAAQALKQFYDDMITPISSSLINAR